MVFARFLRSSSLYSARRALSTDALSQRFRQAVAALQAPPPSPSSPKRDVSSDDKLRLYALFKQAEQGDCDGTARPGVFDLVGRAKHDAWHALRGTLSKDQAMERYIAAVSDIFDGKLPNVAAAAAAAAPAANAANAAVAAPRAPRSLTEIAFPRKAFPSSSKAEPLSTIDYAVHGERGVAEITLNRSTRGNAFNVPMWEDLHESWRRVARDERVKVVLLRGHGANFSTGMDLSVFVDFQRVLSGEACEGRKREAVGEFIDYLQAAISGPETSPVPVIAAVHGQCIGGAIDLICAADLRYCTKDTVFCVKETDLAIVADIGTLQRLPKLIGTQRTAELTYTARNFSGADAEAWGLVAKAFDTQSEMNEYVDKIANEIAKKSPLTIRGTKRTILYARDHSVSESLQQVKLWNSAHLLSNDLAEAAMAIMQKRAPDFKDM